MRIRNTLLTAATLTMMVALPARAQVGGAYDLHWNRPAGDGQTLAMGGAYRLGSTASQPAAGSLTGGSYTLAAGFWITSIDPSVGVDHEEPTLPLKFAAWLDGPNPIERSSSLRFNLPEPQHVSILLFGVDGRLVRELVNGAFGSGRHAAYWDGSDRAGRAVAPGIYFARVVAGASQTTLRLVRLH